MDWYWMSAASFHTGSARAAPSGERRRKTIQVFSEPGGFEMQGAPEHSGMNFLDTGLREFLFKLRKTQVMQ
jgi:hypothetical protein